jgi:hypothetical protein
MRLKELVEALPLEVRCGAEALDRQVRGGYASDLMSDVLAHAQEGDLWITLQTHANVAAVAAMKELAAVVLINGREPESETLEKARARDIPLLVSPLPAFELIGRLHQLGLGARRRSAGSDAEGA